MYDNGTDGWVETQVWYVETTVDGFIDEGEALKITGMHDRFEGGRISIRYTGEQVGSMTLPTNFP
jgi:hypothetical protein